MEVKLAAPSTNKIPKRVLVAPLDWGLGHATRCVPIIRGLLQRGAQVWLAGEGAVQVLLQAEFPNLPFLPLEGYRVTYGQSGTGTQLRLLRQLPRILSAIRHENNWLQTAMEQYGFDVVISDNRYGLYHPAVESVFITHQLQIRSPFAFFSPLLLQAHYRLIQKFDACWVPDVMDKNGLAEALSHPSRLPHLPTRYIGWLSRMQPNGEQETGPVLVLLSGPEPQRSLLEQIILAQCSEAGQPLVLVRGLPGNETLPSAPPNLAIYNHLPASALAQHLNSAAFVIARSGYSTIMDLAALHKKSILIPTPGQTEQTYLARHLQQQGLALLQNQQHFNLKDALQKAAAFAYRPFPPAADGLTPALERLLLRQDR